MTTYEYSTCAFLAQMPKEIFIKGGGPHSTMDSVLATHRAAPGSNPGILKVFSENFLDVNCCQVNQQHCCLEQWTGTGFDQRTASGKLLLQKNLYKQSVPIRWKEKEPSNMVKSFGISELTLKKWTLSMPGAQSGAKNKFSFGLVAYVRTKHEKCL